MPDFANTDQGSQSKNDAYLEAVESVGVTVSMDGKGRWIDNRMIKRLWRSVKYEDIYLRNYLDGLELGRGLTEWFREYNERRPHEALNYASPSNLYQGPGAYGATTKPR